MRALFDSPEDELPERLEEDLAELLDEEPDALLSWEDIRDESDRPRWFQVLLYRRDGVAGLRFSFWIPAWMKQAGVAAMLPARLRVDDCEPGAQATTHLAASSLQEVRSRLPQAAHLVARLMNDLWGPTEAEDVWLREIGPATESV